MDMLKFLFHLFMLCLVISALGDCQYSWCGDNNIIIRFPFRLQGQQQPHCGYPGFKLICTNDSRIVLTLPHTRNFYVRKINYLRQQMQVYDPDDCLPNRLQNLNLSGSPFTVILLRSYTFLSCPTQNMGSQFIPVECLSNSTHFVSAVLSVNLTRPLPQSCNVMRNLSVPVANFRDHLSEDLWLSWYSPGCRQCESQGDMCGFESSYSHHIRCFSDQQSGNYVVLFTNYNLNYSVCQLICLIRNLMIENVSRSMTDSYFIISNGCVNLRWAITHCLDIQGICYKKLSQ